ncbi:hypothetical protein N7478_009369 [Penicillium angulare]|uniref:uncharacterized protein n=1 Tax=Penicillium angulare TaxID=116970 RepID=UPI0025410F59|nr:uncharacterized protein N7478_009369 [Penicillium angulare]KAJ5266561.1 hypothetical protein N7478_009369 [Penicillium angulare]
MDPIIAVVGATGTGKSKLAVDLACRFNGEIINGDAMQMYRGLPIITNQIPVEERNGIPHHLLSCVGFEKEAWRIGQFKQEALRIIDDIRSRGKVPVLVGGTHYYTQAVLFKDSLVGEAKDQEDSDAPESMEASTGVTSTSEKWPILDAEPEVMMEKLREVDPAMAARWHPKDGRKIRRSLEIYFTTGRPASEIYAEQKASKSDALVKEEGLLRFKDTMIFWVHAEKETLDTRLASRVDTMIEQGLMEEAQTMSDYLKNKQSEGIEVDQTRGVWVSIGFKEMAPYFAALDNAVSSESELEKLKTACIEQIRIATRQYGVSQVKWIRNKLWRALSEAGMIRRLYLLDSTDVSKWKQCITDPSENLYQTMLQGELTPDPKSLSSLANEVFGAKEAKARTQSTDTTCHFCEICQRTMAGEEQYKNHINSKYHKGAIKSAARKAERDAYFAKRELGSMQ